MNTDAIRRAIARHPGTPALKALILVLCSELDAERCRADAAEAER